MQLLFFAADAVPDAPAPRGIRNSLIVLILLVLFVVIVFLPWVRRWERQQRADRKDRWKQRLQEAESSADEDGRTRDDSR